jgi:hypothetical protein
VRPWIQSPIPKERKEGRKEGRQRKNNIYIDKLISNTYRLDGGN